VLDAPPELGLARSRGGALGEDRFEGLDLAFHARVRAAFLEIAAADPARVRVIDATRPLTAVADEASAILDGRLQ
jgi:dTMP kinase